MEQIVLSYKNVYFPQYLRGVEVTYAGPPRVEYEEVERREKEAFERGHQEATDKLNQQILNNRQEIHTLMGETMEVINNRVDECIKEMFNGIPSLVTEVTRRVLADVDWNGEMVQRIFEDLLSDIPSNRESITVYLNPDDLALIRDHMEDLDKRYRNCVFDSDADLARGDCRVESSFGEIDGRIGTKLKHIEEQLSN